MFNKVPYGLAQSHQKRFQDSFEDIESLLQKLQKHIFGYFSSSFKVFKYLIKLIIHKKQIKLHPFCYNKLVHLFKSRSYPGIFLTRVSNLLADFF